MTEAVLELRFDTADAFLDGLQAFVRARQARFGEIAFRGQGASDWGLVPAAFRSDVKLGYSVPVVPPLSNIEDQARAEYRAIADFVALSDRVGLSVVYGSEAFLTREAPRPSDHSFWRSWPPPDLLQAIAVSQHNTVPTRLLDFTYDSSTAAFFAGLQRARFKEADRRAHPDIAVWAVDLRFIRRAWDWQNVNGRRIREVTVLRGSNPYLHAQHGMFLVDTKANELWQDGHPEQLDAVIQENAAYWERQGGFWNKSFTMESVLPVVTKFVCSDAVGRKLLETLHHSGLTLAHLMPSYQGVIQALSLQRSLRP